MAGRNLTAQPQSASPAASGRHYGIDLMRILSMFYVVVLHTLGHGGVLDAAAEGSPQYMTAWFLEMSAYGAVNMFAMISGYVSYSEQPKKLRVSSYLLLWLQVVFYGVAVTLIFRLFHPGMPIGRDLLEMITPVTSNLYWYFTAYTCLFFLTPLLNAALRSCPEKTLRKLFPVLLICVFYERFAKRFGFENGYAAIWLVFLYLFGGIIRKCGIGSRLKASQAFLAALLCNVIGWAWTVSGVNMPFTALGDTRLLFVSYLSPTVLASSMFQLIGFSKLRVSARLRRVVAFAAPGAFAAYLLNCQKHIWTYGISQRFAPLSGLHPILLCLAVVGFALVFLTASILIDHVRMRLFRLLRVRELVERLTASVEVRLYGSRRR